MAGSARDISRRIRGISSTKQITRAMEMVSSVKMRKARAVLEQSRPYYNTVIENIQSIMARTNGHPLLDPREIKRTLFIILASDRGLAGGYNAQLNRVAIDAVESTDSDVTLITVGSKPYEYFRTRGVDITDNYVGISEDPSFSEAQVIGKQALELYESGEVDLIKVIYTHFENMISYEPVVLDLLPTPQLQAIKTEGPVDIMEFEPSEESVLDSLIPMYINSAIYGALIEASASEQSARQVAMESATENAEELVAELELRYNRIRQEAITMEITEIVSGADALK